ALDYIRCPLAGEEGELEALGRGRVVFLEINLAGYAVEALTHEAQRHAPIDHRVRNGWNSLRFTVLAAGAVDIRLEAGGDDAVHSADRVQIGAAVTEEGKELAEPFAQVRLRIPGVQFEV